MKAELCLWWDVLSSFIFLSPRLEAVTVSVQFFFKEEEAVLQSKRKLIVI